MVTELNESNFDQFVDSNSLAIIDCWAPWCGPCRRMGPIVEELGLPPGDYMPSTLEEKIVAHADNMVSDNRVVPHSHSVDKLVYKGAFRGAERIEVLHMELSDLYGEDLDSIIGRIGEYPELKCLPEDDGFRGLASSGFHAAFLSSVAFLSG